MRMTEAKAAVSFEATCVRLTAKAKDAASIRPVLERHEVRRGADDAVVEIKAAGVNPSDVKAATGLMPYAVFPRTPGRDFAGVVVDGPSHWLGKEVFGTSGDLGIRRDGTHATHLVVEAAALVEKPSTLSMEEAAGIGVPFVTAIEGFRRAGEPVATETVLIMGINGKVGQAAAQLAAIRDARIIGVARGSRYAGYAAGPIDMIDATTTRDIAGRVRELTDGKGADMIFNTVGDPYFQDAHKSLALAGRQILIAAIDRIVQFNILEFYRGRHTYVGIDTLALSSVESGDRLRGVRDGFASGKLRPFRIAPHAIYGLSHAAQAYAAVHNGPRDRVLIKPDR